MDKKQNRLWSGDKLEELRKKVKPNFNTGVKYISVHTGGRLFLKPRLLSSYWDHFWVRWGGWLTLGNNYDYQNKFPEKLDS